MSLLDRPVRPKPDRFTVADAPPGIANRIDAYMTLSDGSSWAADRPIIDPNTIVVHTNAASVEASVQSSINFGRSGRDRTKPHYVVGDKSAKVLATNRRGIANSTGSSIEAEYGVKDSSYWSIAVETADMGTIAAAAAGYPAGDLGPFLYDNADDVAHIIAYESIVNGFPLEVPKRFPDGGVVAHTWPFPYPYFTTKAGKTCPGQTKIDALFAEILPRAIQIRDAWTGVVTDPQEDPMLVIRPFGAADQFLCVPIDTPAARRKFGIPDTQAPVLVSADLEQIEAQIPYKLSRIDH